MKSLQHHPICGLMPVACLWYASTPTLSETFGENTRSIFSRIEWFIWEPQMTSSHYRATCSCLLYFLLGQVSQFTFSQIVFLSTQQDSWNPSRHRKGCFTESFNLSNLQVLIVATAVAWPLWRQWSSQQEWGKGVSRTQLRNTTWGVHFLRFRCVGMALLSLHLPMVVFWALNLPQTIDPHVI